MVAAIVCLATVKRPICYAAANVVTCLKTHISLRYRWVSCQCTLSQVLVLGALLALWRSGQSVALVTPGSCVVKTIFVKGVDGHTVVHRVHEHTVVGDLLDCTEDVWVTYNGKLVQPGDTIGHIGIGMHDTFRCGVRLRGGAQRYVRNRLTFRVSGRVRRVGKNGDGL